MEKYITLKELGKMTGIPVVDMTPKEEKKEEEADTF